MAEFPGIRYNPALSESMDYFFLRKEGIRYIQALSGEIWTDYNEHDPGVTILDQLCYALTVVGYKTNIDIGKLIFSGDNQQEIARSNGIYPPAEIFLSGTVTVNDFRILFIDKLRDKKVDNIWFKKARNNRIKGLYDAYIRTSAEASAYQQIAQRVRALYAAHRSIGEDLDRVILLRPEPIEIVVSLEISEDVLPEKVLSEMFFRLHEYFNPGVVNSSFDELLMNGLSYDAIFDLPSFEHGFIQDLRTHDEAFTFPLSAINAIIAAVPGIRNVKNLLVKKNGIKVTGKYLTIDEGHIPEVLIIPEKAGVTVLRNHNKLNYDVYLVTRYFHEKIAQGNKSHLFIPLATEKEDKAYREQIGAYTSVQNTFPTVYGIGDYGLPDDAGHDRIKYARQLQSYLLFFDQIMINHLAQVENLRHLFSYKADAGHEATYFSKLPKGDKGVVVADFDKLVNPGLDGHRLQQLLHDDYRERKNRLLDHLLARFSETFIDPSYSNLATLLGLTDADDLQQTLVVLKSKLLEHYITLSRNRNKGCNYAVKHYTNEYPFKTKLCLLLNIPLENVPMLTDQYKDLKGKEIPGAGGKTGDIGKKDLNSVRFKRLNSTDARDQIIFYGSLRDSYSIRKSAEKNGSYKVWFRTPQDKSSTVLGEYDSSVRAEAVVTSLVKKFRELNKRAEGFHVIEHILLRPLLEKQYDLELAIPDKKDKMLFRSVASDYLEDQRKVLMDAIISGTSPDNYRVIETGKVWIIKLLDRDQNELLQLDKDFGDRKKADEYIHEVLVPHFNVLDSKDHTIPPDVSFKQVIGPVPREDFHTLKITLLFPKWIPRFDDPDFRILLKHSLCKCLPAHIGVNLIWLSLNKMTKFEKQYKDWFLLKSQIAGKWNTFMENEMAGGIRQGGFASAYNRKEKRALRSEIIQLDKLSDSLLNSFCITGKR